MKKIIVLSAVAALLAINCKKKSSSTTSTSVTCVYKLNNGVKTFYKCASNSTDAGNYAVEIRNSGSSSTTESKASCSDCQ